MPFVHIRSLHRDRPPDLPAVLEAICADLASATGVDVAHFSATWVDMRDGSYVAAGTAAPTEGSHPLLIDVVLPDLHPEERIQALLQALPAALQAHAGIPPERVFADVRLSRSGHVLDAGEIVRWNAAQ